MLPDTPQVEEVILGSGGILTHPPRGRLVIDMSTISPQATQRMSAVLAQITTCRIQLRSFGCMKERRSEAGEEVNGYVKPTRRSLPFKGRARVGMG
jgi:hypothetical protein